MLKFPQQSIDRAREIVSYYNQRTKSKLKKARLLYNKKFFEIRYGFNEAIKSGNCGKYLHEIVKDCDCFVMAGVLYLIAKQAGLKPKIYEAHGMRDLDEGEKPEDRALNDHTFITASLRKNKTHILDPNMYLFGEATFYPHTNEIKVYDKKESSLTLRTYASLKKLSEQKYLEKLEQARSSEGGRRVLSYAQKLSHGRNRSTFVSYISEKDSLRSSIHVERILFVPEPYSKDLIIDLITPVEPNGKFDFNKGTLHYYFVRAAGWSEHEIPQVPFVFSVKNAKKIWNIWEFLALKSGRKSPVQRTSEFRLEKIINRMGFENDFTIKKNSRAERLIKGNLKKDFDFFMRAKSKAVTSFINECRKDEISYKVLLRAAKFMKARRSAKSSKNPKGFLFSKKEHEELLLYEFKKYKIGLKRNERALINTTAVRCKIKEGSPYSCERKIRSSLRRLEINGKHLVDMGGVRRYEGMNTFHEFADRSLFGKKIDLELSSIKDLEKGVSNKDIREAAQERLYFLLLNTLTRKKSLFLAQYKKGLEKILNREN